MVDVDEAKDRKRIRDAGIGILMFAALGVFIVLLVTKHASRPVPWQAWIAPAVLIGVGVAILARSIIATWIALGAVVVMGVGGAIGALRDGGSVQLILIWPGIAFGVGTMLYRALQSMKRLQAAKS
jgi:hypothetical protein